MKNILFIFLFILLLGKADSQWIANYGGSMGDVNFSDAKGNAITTDNSGYSYVTGFSNEGAVNGNDIIVIKYTPSGDTSWVRTYNGSANGDDVGSGICVDAQGNVYVVGSAKNLNRGFDVVILKYNANGVFQWAMPYYSDNAEREDRGLGITVDNYGYIYITGYTTFVDNYSDIFTIKYDPDGIVLWTKIEDGTKHLDCQGLAITVSSQGNVYVAGYVTMSETNTDIALIKYNSQGTKLWMNTEHGQGGGEDKAWGIVVDGYENVYITGYVTTSVGNTDAYTAKYNSWGTKVWESLYNGNSNQNDKAWGIVVDTDGSVYIAGQTDDASLNTDYLTVKYNSSGQQAWYQTYNGSGNGSDVASSLGIFTDTENIKNVVVTGKSWSLAENYDYATIKYRCYDGNLQDLDIYSMSGLTNDIANGLAVSVDNKVFITGFSQLIIDNSYGQSVISTLKLNNSKSISLTNSNNTPKGFSLSQNYPNPFNPNTNIKFEIYQAGPVKLIVYDVVGKIVDILVNQNMNSGSYSVNYQNNSLSSGIYFYELSSNGLREVKKMTLVK